MKADQEAAFADRNQETLTLLRLMYKRASNFCGFADAHRTANSDDGPGVFRLRVTLPPDVLEKRGLTSPTHSPPSNG